MALAKKSRESDLVDRLLDYLKKSTCSYTATAQASRLLSESGFTEFKDSKSTPLKPAKGYFTHREHSSLVAWVMPKKTPSRLKVIGAHTDSPCLKLKPKPFYTKDGYLQCGVEVYGGVLLHTWMDRDLSLSGIIYTRSKNKYPNPNWVRTSTPVARVSSLAIHLDREVNEKGLQLNRQLHLPPILGLTLEGQSVHSTQAFEDLFQIKSKDILGFDLSFWDSTPPACIGIKQDLLASGRLDNLVSSHLAIEALIKAKPQNETLLCAALFDHEEVGSESLQGAGGSLLEDTLCQIFGPAHRFHSDENLMVSLDMAHAVHPNYSERHEPRHMPKLGFGPVLKSNVQLRYATNARTSALWRQICEDAKIPLQEFVMRTDLACGSTIGPIVSARLGIPTVDVGTPMLSMHSIRELTSLRDVELTFAALNAFFGDQE